VIGYEHTVHGCLVASGVDYRIQAYIKQVCTALNNALRDRCTVLARLQGESPQGSVNLIYLTTPHRQIASVLQTAREVDPDIFFLVERVRGWSENLRPVASPTGWRAVMKKK